MNPIVLKEEGRYRLVRRVDEVLTPGSAAVYQIEDRQGRVVCGCGNSLSEATAIFMVLMNAANASLAWPTGDTAAPPS